MADLVDNPVQGTDLEPNSEPVGKESTEPTGGESRSPEILHKLLDGADPAELFGEKNNEPNIEPEPNVEPRIEVPDKFKNKDGSINTEAVVKSYLEMEKKLGEQGDRLGRMAQLEEELQQLRAVINQEDSAPKTQPEPEQLEPEFELIPEELSPEEKEKLIEEYYEDPLGFLNKMLKNTTEKLTHKLQSEVQKAIEPVKPVVDRYQYEEQVNAFNQQIEEFTKDGKHADFFDLVPQMQQIIQEYGSSITQSPNAVQMLYDMAKGRASSQSLSVEDMLQNNEIRQKVIAQVKDQIIKDYIQGVQKGQPPIQIGAQPGGEVVSAPSEKPRSAREATSMLRRLLQKQ